MLMHIVIKEYIVNLETDRQEEMLKCRVQDLACLAEGLIALVSTVGAKYLGQMC